MGEHIGIDEFGCSVPGLEVFEGFAMFFNRHVINLDALSEAHVCVELVCPRSGMSLSKRSSLDRARG